MGPQDLLWSFPVRHGPGEVRGRNLGEIGCLERPEGLPTGPRPDRIQHYRIYWVHSNRRTQRDFRWFRTESPCRKDQHHPQRGDHKTGSGGGA